MSGLRPQKVPAPRLPDIHGSGYLNSTKWAAMKDSGCIKGPQTYLADEASRLEHRLQLSRFKVSNRIIILLALSSVPSQISSIFASILIHDDVLVCSKSTGTSLTKPMAFPTRATFSLMLKKSPRKIIPTWLRLTCARLPISALLNADSLRASRSRFRNFSTSLDRLTTDTSSFCPPRSCRCDTSNVGSHTEKDARLSP